jgi:acyl-CoA synthetase (AMP-forming)/AMP-acid ligase II
MIFEGPYPEIVVPEISITDFLYGNIEGIADKAALVDGPSGRVLTYGQLAASINRAAAGLYQRGFRQGDVLALYSPNLPEYAIAFHAAVRLGGIVTTSNPLYKPAELARQLNDSRSKFLVTIPQFLEAAQLAVRDTSVKEIFVFGEAAGATPFSTLLQSDAHPPAVTIEPRSDVVALPYSSGTSGLPKGVMLTHYNLVANILQLHPCVALDGNAICLGLLPFFHIYGMVVIMAYVHHIGGTIVCMPRFDLEQFLQTLQDYKVTWAPLAPPLVLALAKHPIVDQYDLSSLKRISSGAAPLNAAIEQAAAQRIGAHITQGYGMTEASPATHGVPADPAQYKQGSVGPCLSNTQTRIVDPVTLEELGINQLGEIWVRGPQVMKGYLNNPEATAETIVKGGWLRTGDIGYIDNDGYLFIVDRLKELIKYKGMAVAPAVLEGILLTHNAIADAAVIPFPDEEAGEIPKACVVLKPGQVTSPEAIMDFVAEQVAPHERIRRVEFVDEIPKSASGKILRRLLIEDKMGNRLL